MSAILTTIVSLLSLAAALPSPASAIVSDTADTYPLGTKLSFSQTSYDPTNNVYLAADIAPVSTEPGACYPHNYATTYVAPTADSLLNFTTTGKTKANGHTPINSINIGGAPCWVLTIETGIVTVRQGGDAKGWYVLNGTLMNDAAPHGFYYCYDSGGNGIVGVEDKKKSHNGGIYAACFETVFTAFATPS